MSRPTIYLIGDDGGAAKTNNPNAAARFVEILGYRVCSHEEYAERLRWQQKEDAKAVREEKVDVPG